MTTIDVYISGIEVLKEVDKIANDFPCFVNYEPTTKEIEWEVSIFCRQEDAKTIESRLAKWV